MAIKSDEYVEEPPIPASEWIAKIVKGNLGKLPFASFFQNDPILVPVPGSSLTLEDSLWVPNRIATAMVREGLGKGVVAFLVRKSPVRKSAYSKASERPKVTDHFNSMDVQTVISQPPPREIVLVEDIITRGATLLGAANRLVEVLPSATIRGFAAVRTISNATDFEAMSRPVMGTVQHRPEKDDTIRRP